METSPRFRSHPKVVHQTIDGEAILIHMENGNYFSLQESSSVAWTILSDGCSAAELVARLRQVCTGCPDGGLEQDVAAFIEELRKEDLIVEGDGAGIPVILISVPYTPLAFQKFSDMQDLLLADPIHEVSEAGWPMLPPGVKP
ncbi:MAG: PqqD family protein [Phycisphaerales bacterium]